MEKTEQTIKEKCKFYQAQRDYRLDIEKPIIVHIDGRSFSKLIKDKFEKPFDTRFVTAMNYTAGKLCEEIQGCQFAYVQSDEINLLILKKREESDIFFGGRLCKMQSIIASIATAAFNKWMIMNALSQYDEDCLDIETEPNMDKVRELVDLLPLYQFDCKVWDVPGENDAKSWFLFRNIDCVRNSKQQFAQAFLNQHLLIGLSSDEQIDLVKETINKDWHNIASWYKYGRYVIREPYTKTIDGEEVIRHTWAVYPFFDLTDPEQRNNFWEEYDFFNKKKKDENK